MLSRRQVPGKASKRLKNPIVNIKSISYIGLWIYTTKLSPLSPKKWGYMIDIKGMTKVPSLTLKGNPISL